jgi:hypothetical protein
MAADGQPGFIECKPNKMTFTIDAPDFDPFVANVLKEGGSLVGGTGVMFSNRRRNKWAGRTNDAQRDGKRLTFGADVNESMGYAPLSTRCVNMLISDSDMKELSQVHQYTGSRTIPSGEGRIGGAEPEHGEP